MKKIIGLLISSALILSAFAGCESNGNEERETTVLTTATELTEPELIVPDKEDNVIINVWVDSYELETMLRLYKIINPDFPYTFHISTDTVGSYIQEVTNFLRSEEYINSLRDEADGGWWNAPYFIDIYIAESSYVTKFTQGEFSRFAAAYDDLGIDTEKLIKEAGIAPYAYEAGTRNGEIVALPYQGTGGAFIYRRSIAIDTWGTDDPDFVQNKIGPGWDKFLAAAAELNAKDYSIVSSAGDVWLALKDNAVQPWIVDNRLVIDPGRLQFFEIAKQLYQNGYMNDTAQWQPPWHKDMNGEGDRQVFGYFGPAWFVNYVMSQNAEGTYGDWALCLPPSSFAWGGTWVMANRNLAPEKIYGVSKIIEWLTLDTSETGLQYQFANAAAYNNLDLYWDWGWGKLKDTVSSAAVMAKSDGTLDFLGGQNMFDVFIPAGENARAAHWHEYDHNFNSWFQSFAALYFRGQKTHDEAVADFKEHVKSEFKRIYYLDIETD